MLSRFLSHHVLANLTFVLVLIVGSLVYTMLPREKDPSMNFNWIQVTTLFPGASAEDVERLITDPLEEAVAKIADIKFVSSNSRQALSSILVRFNELDSREFDKRLSSLRREVRNKERELPAEAEDPLILEITSANAFPTATIVIQGLSDDENLRQQARQLVKDMERIKGVSGIIPVGLQEPEIQIRFYPERLIGLGITPTSLADTLSSRFRDSSAGSVDVGKQRWLIRFQGTTPDPEAIANWSIAGPKNEITLGQVADISIGREKAQFLVRHNGRPAVLFPVMKKAEANELELTERLRNYIDKRNSYKENTGVELILVDDQSSIVRNALAIMENNALLGLLLVALVSWFFLGTRISFLIGLGIPFTLAGTFILLHASGFTLNVMVLLGVVISLGMLVDDAVVVVEAIVYHIQRGQTAAQASITALREVFAPVTASVLTTMAAFLPLMLLPGILGTYMRVIPLVVTMALAISLLEAFWMLPSHVMVMRVSFSSTSRFNRWRQWILHRVRNSYLKVLLTAFRRPMISLAIFTLPFFFAIGSLVRGDVRVEFFAMDPIPLFYISVEMPPASSLENTIVSVEEVEKRARASFKPNELREMVGYAGQMFTEMAPFFGDQYGQLLVSLNPDSTQRRTVSAIIEGMREQVTSVPGPQKISFLPMTGGPPVTKAIQIKVRGFNYEEIKAASETLKELLRTKLPAHDITDDAAPGRWTLGLTPNDDALRRASVPPGNLIRLTRLLADGEVVAAFQNQGEKVNVRVLPHSQTLTDSHDFLRYPIETAQGSTPLGSLVQAESRISLGNIRHVDFRRAITVEADLDKEKMDTVSANAKIMEEWNLIAADYPNVSLDFSGELDDIQESMDNIVVLFIFGLGLMYMILGTQFNSYFQPFLILITVPMAFTGVILGLYITGHPLSLYTLYGIVALSGIAVNASIVLISAANSRRKAGMSVLHAIVYAARRRVIPILITTLTTIAGLFSLATGLAGHSLLWGPVATAIVWGLAFSTALTLFLAPLVYLVFMRRQERKAARQAAG